MGTTTTRLQDGDVRWHLGMKSDADPGMLPPGAFYNAVNLVCRGGVLQTRPGYRCKLTLPDGNLQGAALFRPKAGLEQMVVVVDGKVHVAAWPFLNFRLLTNVLLSAHAKQVFFCLAEQTQKRRTTALDSEIDFIDPRAVIFIQDGGTSACAWYDGSQSGQCRDDMFGMPVGGPMRWVGNRLWVAIGSMLRASDIGNPFSFRELLYPGGVSALHYPLPVTALAETPGVADPNLLVFTDQSVSMVRANIRVRSQWEQTANFNVDVFPIGTYSQRSIVIQNGLLWWYSPRGLIALDAAEALNTTSQITPRDSAMTISKTKLSGDQSLVAGAAFGSYLLMSIPHADIFNTHTWVLDTEAVSEEVMPWQGIWTGTRPVEWMYGSVLGKERIYYVSKDYDGKNRLWEAFTEERDDNGCPISWAVETRGFFGPVSSGNYPALSDKTFCYAELQLAELTGLVDVGGWWAGVSRGAYKPCMIKRINAGEGNIHFDRPLTESSILFACKPQSRRIKTRDVREDREAVGTSCHVERDQVEDTDDAFQLLFVGSGACAIRWLRCFAMPEPQDLSADCETDEAEENLVRFDGLAAEGATFEEAVAALEEGLPVYESVRTKELAMNGLTVVGSGYARSLVSQDDADKIAETIATRHAERQLENQLPLIISDGQAFDEDVL